jgi:hypothetical protein
MRFKICLEQEEKEFYGNKDCGNLSSSESLDKIESLTDKFETKGFTIDHGGDEEWYELTICNPCSDNDALEMLSIFETELNFV